MTMGDIRNRVTSASPQLRSFRPMGLGIIILVLSTSGCGGGAAGPAVTAPTQAVTPTSRLMSLHDEARVPGLEDRRFDQESYELVDGLETLDDGSRGGPREPPWLGSPT